MQTVKKELCLGLLFLFLGFGNIAQAYKRIIINKTPYALHYEIVYLWGKHPGERFGWSPCTYDYSQYSIGPILSGKKRTFPTPGCLLKRVKVYVNFPGNIKRSATFIPGGGDRVGNITFNVFVIDPSAPPRKIKLIIEKK